MGLHSGRRTLLPLGILALIITYALVASLSVLSRSISPTNSNNILYPTFDESAEIYSNGWASSTGCAWHICPEKFGMNHRKGGGRKRVAIVVSGQLSRLELRSKMINLVRENYQRYELYAVFLLQQGKNSSSNYHERSPGPYQSEEWEDMEVLREHVGHIFSGFGWKVSPIHHELSYSGKWYNGDKLTRQVFYFVLKDQDEVLLRVAFGLTKGEPIGALLLNPDFVPNKDETTKQLNQQDMFRNMRKTMMLLEDIELRMGFFVHLVFRLREDVFVLRPFRFPRPLTRVSFVSPNCWTAGGLSDWSFIVGRQLASKVIRGLAEDYYLRIHAHYTNPEHFVRYLARFHRAKIIKLSVCEWPMLPVIFYRNRTDLYMRLRTESRLSAVGGCSLKPYKGSCFWKESPELTKGTRKPYLNDKFTTWT